MIVDIHKSMRRIDKGLVGYIDEFCLKYRDNYVQTAKRFYIHCNKTCREIINGSPSMRGNEGILPFKSSRQYQATQKYVGWVNASYRAS